MVRPAGTEDAEAVGRLLHDFNVEHDEATPGPHALAERVGDLMSGGDTVVLLVGDGPDGLPGPRPRRDPHGGGDSRRAT
jgi:hypothetical protein